MSLLHPHRYLALLLIALAPCIYAQEEAELPPPASAPVPAPTEELAVPPEVVVEPVRDEEIQQRLTDILSATERFTNLDVRVQNGVVFLEGIAEQAEHKEWARQLSLRTTDVVAVVNNLTDADKNPWDFSPAMEALRDIWTTSIQSLPLVGFSIIVLLLTGFIAMGVARGANKMLERPLPTPLLRKVISNIIGGLVLILGVYVILRTANLTGLAATVVGGTGLVGLILGIGFRDISENFLASLLLSIQKPFQPGDAVKIDVHEGVVERLTARGTLLMGWDGKFIQIPNSIVYKNIIINMTANPRQRVDFLMRIPFQADIACAQDAAMKVLREHPAVLDDPEASVLVDSLADDMIALKVYFWFDAGKHSLLKVKSAVMRLMVVALEEAGVEWPSPVQAIVFPDGVSVTAETIMQGPSPEPPRKSEAATAVATDAEGWLQTETEVIKEQAKQSRLPEVGKNILEDAAGENKALSDQPDAPEESPPSNPA